MSNTLQIVGFIRVGGFDHLVRFVTDAAPNEYGQRFVVYQDGAHVFGNFQTAGTPEMWLPLDQLSGEERGIERGRTELTEFAACRQWIDADMATPSLADKRPFAFDA